MIDILIVCDSPKEWDELYKELLHHIRDNVNGLRYAFPNGIWTNHCHIQFVSGRYKGYRGLRPEYFYAYGTEVVSYLAATGAKRLNSLDGIIELVKGEDYS